MDITKNGRSDYDFKSVFGSSVHNWMVCTTLNAEKGRREREGAINRRNYPRRPRYEI